MTSWEAVMSPGDPVRVVACGCLGKVTSCGKAFARVVITNPCPGGTPQHMERITPPAQVEERKVTLTFRYQELTLAA